MSNSIHAEVDRFMAGLCSNNPHQPEFQQAVQEVAESVMPLVLDDERFRRTVFNNIYNPSQPQSERKEFLLRVHYQAGQFGDPVAIGQLMGRLRDEERTRLIERKKASDGPLRQLSEAPEAQPAHQAPAPPARRTGSPPPRPSPRGGCGCGCGSRSGLGSGSHSSSAQLWL